MRFFQTFLSIRRRVRQRATRFSALVVILLFGLFFEAYMHNFNLVYIVLFFVFALAFAAGPVGMRNIGYLDAKCLGSSRLFANKEGVCYFQITNRSSSSAWAITLHTALAKKRLKEIAPHATRREALRITPTSRGRLNAAPCTLESLFPLSTVRFVLPIEDECTLLVYPEPKGLPLRSYLQQQRSYFGEENDFDGIAPYSGFESPSRIHWPSIAKGESAIKTFEHEAKSQTLHFDFLKCADNDEARLCQLTLWVLECERAGVPFTITMPHKLLDSKKESIDAILEVLALY